MTTVVSPFAPSLFDESRPTNLLQMWRELENKHLLSSQSCSNRPSKRPRNGSDTECSSTPNVSVDSNDIEYEESNSITIILEELGEREWMRSGSKGNPSSGFCLYNRSDVCESMHEGPVAARPIRKLCGRQTLVDLVMMRAKSERKRELLCLEEQKLVSESIRRKALWNEKPVLDERSTYRAATELRKGFIDSCAASNSLNRAELHSCCSHESSNVDLQTESGNQDMSHALFAQDLAIAKVNYYNTYHEDSDGNYEESDSRDAWSQVERLHESVTSRDEEEESCAYVEPFDNRDVEEQEDESHVHWGSHDLHQTIDTYYPLDDDDDNGCNMGLRELFSRRIVSSLLGSSGFRERLNRVVQSHAKRIASDEPEPESDDVSLTEGDEEHIINSSSDETWLLSDPFVVPSTTLFARRIVSTLLGSGFGEKLNQVLQSHAKRIAREAKNRIDDVSLSEGDQEQINGFI